MPKLVSTTDDQEQDDERDHFVHAGPTRRTLEYSAMTRDLRR